MTHILGIILIAFGIRYIHRMMHREVHVARTPVVISDSDKAKLDAYVDQWIAEVLNNK